MRIYAALFTALVMALTGAATASAATVTTDGTTFVYTAAPGETNDVRIDIGAANGTAVYFRDLGGLTAGAGCQPAGANSAICSRGARTMTIALGDGDDAVSITAPNNGTPLTSISGGPGVDAVTYSELPFSTNLSNDGASDDGPSNADNIGPDVEVIEGSQLGDIMRGSNRDDVVVGLRGPDFLGGGGGDDLIDARDLGACDESAADCQDPEADIVECGDGDDIVDGDPFDQVADNCELVVLLGVAELSNKADRFTAFRSGLEVEGLGGNDKLTGAKVENAADTLDGGKGDDTLSGLDGNDVLTGGPGKDKIIGGAGADRLDARDKTKDTIRCGAGKDTVKADKIDSVAKDCERASRR